MSEPAPTPLDLSKYLNGLRLQSLSLDGTILGLQKAAVYAQDFGLLPPGYVMPGDIDGPLDRDKCLEALEELRCIINAEVRREPPPSRPGKRRGRPALESANPRLSALYSLALEALAEGGSIVDAVERLRGNRDAAELAEGLGMKVNARLVERARDWERKKRD